MARSLHPRTTRTAVVAVLLITVLAAFLTGTTAADAANTAPPHAAPPHARTSYEASIANKVLAELNRERTAHHLAKVTMNKNLLISARRHNVSMSDANTMSHQVRGEAAFDSRLRSAGYRYRVAGENIGYNTRMDADGVLALQQIMYNEKPPNDGHRLNILDRRFAEIGIDVYLDSVHHRVWLTQDFGHR